MSASATPYQDIGPWSEIKLEIIKEYATAYSRILSAQRSPPFEHWYIDAFAGAGVHISRTTREFVAGSPLNALLVRPPFAMHHFVDIVDAKVESLNELAGEREDVVVHKGDCNDILIQDVLPQVRFDQFRRALCLLDPYGLHLNWQVIQTAGSLRTIEIFLNFPIYDMNINALRRDPGKVEPSQIARMNAYWGDESWREVAYTFTEDLFGDELAEKQGNETIVNAFKKRLREVAGFQFVADPIPMRNTKGGIVYYLFFASQRPVAAHIVKAIFDKYRNYGV